MRSIGAVAETLCMTLDLMIALARAQGITLDADRAAGIAAAAGPIVAAVTASTAAAPFDAEPDSFRKALEDCA